eukprot:COSAG05_NODE_2428_length_3073_cov_53.487559_2_plen_329_part_00
MRAAQTISRLNYCRLPRRQYLAVTLSAAALVAYQADRHGYSVFRRVEVPVNADSQLDEPLRLAILARQRRPFKTAGEMLSQPGGFQFGPTAGQILPNSGYGQVLYGLAKSPEIKLALETGTWNGGGSSLCIGRGLQDKPNGQTGLLFTIEAFEEKWFEAEHTLAPYPVMALLGVGVDGSGFPTVAEVNADGGIPGTEQSVWQAWWEGEKLMSDMYPVGLIGPLCRRYKVDLVHLDGGEFVGMAEFAEVMRSCVHAKYIALDDTNTFKNRNNRKRLLANSSWEMYKEDQADRHGYSVFRRVEVPVNAYNGTGLAGRGQSVQSPASGMQT